MYPKNQSVTLSACPRYEGYCSGNRGIFPATFVQVVISFADGQSPLGSLVLPSLSLVSQPIHARRCSPHRPSGTPRRPGQAVVVAPPPLPHLQRTLTAANRYPNPVALPPNHTPLPPTTTCPSTGRTWALARVTSSSLASGWTTSGSKATCSLTAASAWGCFPPLLFVLIAPLPLVRQPSPDPPP